MSKEKFRHLPAHASEEAVHQDELANGLKIVRKLLAVETA